MNKLIPMPCSLTERPVLFQPRSGMHALISGYPEKSIPILGEILSSGLGLRLEFQAYTPQLPFPSLVIFFGSYEASLAQAGKALSEVLAGIKDERIKEQAYSLVIESNALALAGGAAAGLFYACQTLLQMVSAQGNIPGALIKDRPALIFRGLLQDLSRGQVLHLESLKELVRTMAYYKYNQLTFNIEHTFAFKKHPAIGAGHDPITREEIKALVEFAEHYHVDIVPGQQSLGHLTHLLKLPEFNHLAFDPQRPWSLDPLKRESYELLADLYQEIIPCYKSRFFNICCDEPFDLASRWEDKGPRSVSFSDAYLDHILRLHRLLKEHDKTMMMWGDMLIGHPWLLGELPGDIIVLDWQYGTGALEGREFYRNGIERIKDAGLPFMSCTCSWALMKIFPTLEVMNANHDNFMPEAKAGGALGNWLTNWGDMGHMNLLGTLAYPLVYAGEAMWADSPADEKAVLEGFSNSFFKDPSGDAGRLVLALQRVNEVMKGMPILAGVGFLCFFDEPLCGDYMLGFLNPVESGMEMDAAADQADVLFNELMTRTKVRGTWLLDLELPIMQMRILADKLNLYGYALRFFHEIKSLDPDAPEIAGGLTTLIQDAQSLARGVAAAREILSTRWLAQARPSDLALNLKRYDRQIETLNMRAEQFEDLLVKAKNKEKLPSWHSIQRDPRFLERKFDMLLEMGLKGIIG